MSKQRIIMPIGMALTLALSACTSKKELGSAAAPTPTPTPTATEKKEVAQEKTNQASVEFQKVLDGLAGQSLLNTSNLASLSEVQVPFIKATIESLEKNGQDTKFLRDFLFKADIFINSNNSLSAYIHDGNSANYVDGVINSIGSALLKLELKTNDTSKINSLRKKTDLNETVTFNNIFKTELKKELETILIDHKKLAGTIKAEKIANDINKSIQDLNALLELTDNEELSDMDREISYIKYQQAHYRFIYGLNDASRHALISSDFAQKVGSILLLEDIQEKFYADGSRIEEISSEDVTEAYEEAQNELEEMAAELSDQDQEDLTQMMVAFPHISSKIMIDSPEKVGSLMTVLGNTINQNNMDKAKSEGRIDMLNTASMALFFTGVGAGAGALTRVVLASANIARTVFLKRMATYSLMGSTATLMTTAGNQYLVAQDYQREAELFEKSFYTGLDSDMIEGAQDSMQKYNKAISEFYMTAALTLAPPAVLAGGLKAYKKLSTNEVAFEAAAKLTPGISDHVGAWIRNTVQKSRNRIMGISNSTEVATSNMAVKTAKQRVAQVEKEIQEFNKLKSASMADKVKRIEELVKKAETVKFSQRLLINKTRKNLKKMLAADTAKLNKLTEEFRGLKQIIKNNADAKIQGAKHFNNKGKTALMLEQEAAQKSIEILKARKASFLKVENDLMVVTHDKANFISKFLLNNKDYKRLNNELIEAQTALNAAKAAKTAKFDFPAADKIKQAQDALSDIEIQLTVIKEAAHFSHAKTVEMLTNTLNTIKKQLQGDVGRSSGLVGGVITQKVQTVFDEVRALLGFTR
jgi:hypothetical protein